MKLWNHKGEQNSITGALRLTIPEHAVISLTGAGGKTSLLFAWARELSHAGKKVVVTTTTHMANPETASSGDPWDGIRVVYTDQADDADTAASAVSEIRRILEDEGIVMAVSRCKDKPHKVSAPPEALMDQIYKLADAVLIEADGSRRMPLKWPAPWEPAVPENTDITVCLAGLSSLGRNPEDVMYRYADLPEAFKRDTIDESLISAVLGSLDGGQKGAGGEFRVFLNQADTPELQLSASRVQQILGLYGIQSAWGILK